MQRSGQPQETHNPTRPLQSNLSRRHSLPSALPSSRPSVVLVSQNGIAIDGSVVCFARSSDALSYLAKAKSLCDVIVLDTDQTHRDSFRLLSFLKRDPLFKRIPVIVASHEFNPGDIFKYVQEGADEIIDLSCNRITELILWMVAWRCNSRLPKSRPGLLPYRRNSIAEVSTYNPRKRILDFYDEDLDLIGRKLNHVYKSVQSKIQSNSSSTQEIRTFRQPETKRSHFTLKEPVLQESEPCSEAIDHLSFNAFEYTEMDLEKAVERMFESVGLIQRFQIPRQKLQRFIKTARGYYRDNFYHNFRHAVDVTQMVYWTMQHADKLAILNDYDKLILMISAICHDLLHPGFNNSFLIKTRHELAVEYDNISVLENLHASTSIKMLIEESTNILCGLNQIETSEVTQGIVQCIMCTDMANHQTLLQSYQETISPPFTMKDEYRHKIRSMVLKFSDISNPARKFDVSKLWSDAIMDENFIQGDIEKSLGFEIPSFIDRTCKDQPNTAIGFSQYVVMPLLQILCIAFPGLFPVAVELDQNISRWRSMGS